MLSVVTQRKSDGSSFFTYIYQAGKDSNTEKLVFFLGYLHKSGIKQLESYIEFAQRLEQEVVIAELSKDIPECVLLVYVKLSTTAHQRFISAEEFLDVAKDYFERVKRVWNWQNQNGPDARQAFRDCPVVKAHPSYR